MARTDARRAGASLACLDSMLPPRCSGANACVRCAGSAPVDALGRCPGQCPGDRTGPAGQSRNECSAGADTELASWPASACRATASQAFRLATWRARPQPGPASRGPALRARFWFAVSESSASLVSPAATRTSVSSSQGRPVRGTANPGSLTSSSPFSALSQTQGPARVRPGHAPRGDAKGSDRRCGPARCATVRQYHS